MSLDFSLGVSDGASSSSARADRRRIAAIDASDDGASSATRSIAPVRFVDADAKERVCRDATANRSIVLRPRADCPGGLAAGIDGDLESALALRGAHPSQLNESADLEERLRDQISRASCVPVKGVCLALPPLGACVEADGVLADVDARYLGAWLAAAALRPLPIAILFDEQDRPLRARVPRSLDDVVAEIRGEVHSPRRRETNAKIVTTTSVTEQITLFADVDGPSVTDHDEATDACLDSDESSDSISIPDLLEMRDASMGTKARIDQEPSDIRVDDVVDEGTSDDATTAVVRASNEAESSLVEGTANESSATQSPHAEEAEPQSGGALYRAKPPPVFARSRRTLEARPTAAIAATEVAAPAARAQAPQKAQKSLAAAMSDTLRPSAPVMEQPVSVAVDTHAEEERVLTLAHWRSHAVELDGARGPKPVSAIERLFAQRYLPLVGALARNEADHAIGSVVEQWSQSFAESYTDSFSALKVTGKRPTMVLDAFDIASRIARLSSARSVKLLLVDSLSFDLAERVATRMKTILDKRAVLVERTTLWSALPTTTPTQMALLGRGADGLRDAAPTSSSEPDIARGRNVGSLRRERIGARELIKLDLVEARLRAPGAPYDQRLDAIAEEVSDIVIKFMETLPPRTLLYVFGDHGFVLGHGANGWATGPATQGGASPEEVLVAGHAWLVDAMQ